MRYLVCQPRGECSVLRIMRDDDRISGHFETWALNNGPRVLFVETALGRLLSKHHMGGSYENGALYGLSHTEMVDVLTSKMGECDRARYERLDQELRAAQVQRDEALKKSKFPLLRLAAAISWGTAKLFTTIIIRGTIMIVWLCVIPILIGVIRGMSKGR